MSLPIPTLRTSDFDYHLPDELIAHKPLPERTDSRLMVVDRKTGSIVHSVISELPNFLDFGDLLVLNNTRVIPARIRGVKSGTGGAVELLLCEQVDERGRWLALCRASRRPHPGSILNLADGMLTARVESVGKEGRITVQLQPEASLMDILELHGEIPLPPYIKRDDRDKSEDLNDRKRYQTVYARHPGAVAAPTAGLHFTPSLLARLEQMGVPHAEVTLHVGIGTFKPVSAEHVRDHCMDEERYRVTAAAAEMMKRTRQKGGRIVAVGSTSVRTLETVIRLHGDFRASEGRSGLFIYPPYKFMATDAMLTNFHLPKSTLLMMVSALAGKALIRKAYQEAITCNYRFFSYGDAMLIR